MGAIALRSSVRARTTNTPMIEAKIPMAGTMRGKSTAGVGFLWMRAEGRVPEDERAR